MCGRYTATQVNPALIADRFGVREEAVPGETLGRFNVCPTEPVLAVTAPGEAQALRWGLIPPWARALRAGPEPINARSESLREKKLFAPLIEEAAPPLPGRGRRLVRVAAAGDAEGAARPVPLHGRRRRAVRVRRAVARSAGSATSGSRR